MKKIVSLLFLFSSITLSAQITGYMGKRVSVGYSNLFSPSIERVSNSSYAPELKIKRLNVSHLLDLNYVIHYRKALCFSFSYLGSKIGNNSVVYEYLHNYKFTESENNAKSSSLGFSIGIKLFKRSFVAPLGPYVKWEGLVLLNSIKYEPYTYTKVNRSNNTYTYETTSYGAGEFKSNGLGIAFSFGQQRVFFDKLLVDCGIRAAAVITMTDYLSSNHSKYESELYNKTSNKMFLQQFINLRLGVGFLY